ncbi:MAG: uracil-DNA glycosylase [Deltaproteobacteria bacterium]|nr:uracil-DNA glycosylase [Deltaproteobacteria bacterium]
MSQPHPPKNNQPPSSIPRINCRLCRHYFITWEPRTPHGCRLMGFKSQFLPYVQVFRISGQECKSFARK